MAKARMRNPLGGREIERGNAYHVATLHVQICEQLNSTAFISEIPAAISEYMYRQVIRFEPSGRQAVKFMHSSGRCRSDFRPIASKVVSPVGHRVSIAIPSPLRSSFIIF